MDRRGFVKLCAGSAAWLAAGMRDARAGSYTDFPKVRLTDAQGAPLKASALANDEAYVFHFPFRSLPCFLIDLGKPASGPQELTSESGSYTWPGGVGKNKSLVAYVAVCTHQLAYASKDGSQIRYAAGNSALAGRPGTIVCCAHASVFDPANGARREHGEARDPLLAVRLEYDSASDALYASGLAGMQLVERFFNTYKRELISEYGPGVYREPVGGTSAAVALSKYATSIGEC
jgi:arsenite oxidase small subunit